MVMTPELDAGPIVAQWPVPLTGRETTPELEAQLSRLAAEVVPPELERWASGALQSEPQDPKQATLIKPFHRADGWLDWRKPADLLDRQVRALSPGPGRGPRSTGGACTSAPRIRRPASTACRSARCSRAPGQRSQPGRARWRWTSCSRRAAGYAGRCVAPRAWPRARAPGSGPGPGGGRLAPQRAVGAGSPGRWQVLDGPDALDLAGAPPASRASCRRTSPRAPRCPARR